MRMDLRDTCVQGKRNIVFRGNLDGLRGFLLEDVPGVDHLHLLLENVILAHGES